MSDEKIKVTLSTPDAFYPPLTVNITIKQYADLITTLDVFGKHPEARSGAFQIIPVEKLKPLEKDNDHE